MDLKNRCVAVIPCCNEATHIGAVVTGVRRHVSKIIVVDDGSTDATAQQAAAAGATVLRHVANCGKGAALQTGWNYVGKLGFDWLLLLDGDGQHAPADIPEFFSGAEKSGAALVVGNRMGNSAAMPWLRRLVNRWMSRRISRLTGATLPDSQCGFRLAHLETLLRLPIAVNRFEIESEMLVAFLAAGHKVEFMPVQTIYKNRRSQIRPLADAGRWLRWRWTQRVNIPLARTAL